MLRIRQTWMILWTRCFLREIIIRARYVCKTSSHSHRTSISNTHCSHACFTHSHAITNSRLLEVLDFKIETADCLLMDLLWLHQICESGHKSCQSRNVTSNLMFFNVAMLCNNSNRTNCNFQAGYPIFVFLNIATWWLPHFPAIWIYLLLWMSKFRNRCRMFLQNDKQDIVPKIGEVYNLGMQA